MFSFDSFTGECSFCYRTIPSGTVTFCSCGTTMCEEHPWHSNPEHRIVAITATGTAAAPEIAVNSYGTELEVEQAEEAVSEAIVNPRYAEEQKTLPACPHIPASTAALEIVSPKCEQCAVDNNSWMCLHCGACLCGRQQYGIEGNGHAMAHFNQHPEHPTFVKLQSVNPQQRRCDVFCYRCDAIVKGQSVLGRLRLPDGASHRGLATSEIEKNLNAEIGQESVMQERKMKYAVTRREGGITDLGNTCYLSTVLQVLSYAVQEFPGVLEYPLGDSTALCDICPLECFGCQLRKVLAHLIESHRTEVPSFSIKPFWKTLAALYPHYELGKQHDAVEVFERLLDTISEMDSFGHFRGLAQKFTGEFDSTLKCTNCGYTSTSTTKQTVVYLGVEQGVTDIFDPEKLDYSCKCQATAVTKTLSLVAPPEVLPVAIKRELAESSDQSQPVLESLAIPSTRGPVRYRLASVIVHEGTLQAGHYMAQIAPSGQASQWKVHDEESVGESPLLTTKVVLMLYRRQPDTAAPKQ